MAYENARTKSIKATAAFTRPSQYSLVKLDTNGQLAPATAGGYAIGVIQDTPAAGDPGAVCYPGDITKVICGGTFTAGQDVCSDSTGRAVAATSGGYVVGQALTAGAVGFLATIVYQPKASKM